VCECVCNTIVVSTKVVPQTEACSLRSVYWKDNMKQKYLILSPNLSYQIAALQPDDSPYNKRTAVLVCNTSLATLYQ
jgi:hypothetical protein